MTRKSKPKRSCGVCKPWKRWGNSKHRDRPSVRREKERTENHD